MAFSSKLERQNRLRDLQVENDLLRDTLAVQALAFDDTVIWIEQAYSMYQMVRANREAISSVFEFFGSKE